MASFRWFLGVKCGGGRLILESVTEEVLCEYLVKHQQDIFPVPWSGRAAMPRLLSLTAGHQMNFVVVL